MILTEQQIEAAFPWGAPREITTKRGLRSMYKAPMTEAGRVFWNQNKAALGAAGVLFGEWPEGSGKWNFTWFRAVSEEVIAQKIASREASRATDAEVEIPKPASLEYLGFQRAGIRYMRGRHGTLLADDMGLGKTIQVLGTINDDPRIVKVLLVCPAGLTLNWLREAAKWLVRPTSFGIVDGKTFPTADFVIISYSMLKKWEPELSKRHWDLLACDEAHQIKNPAAQRSRVILGYKPKREEDPSLARAPLPAGKRIFATGTPLPNKPIELWPLVSVLCPQVFNSWWRFATRYCGMSKGDYGMTSGGTANLEELQVLLRENCMVRRLKADVLTELPPKTRALIPFKAPASLKAQNARWLDEHPESDETVDAEVEMELAKASEDPEAYAAAAEKLGKAQKVAFVDIARILHETGLAKVEPAIEHIKGLLETEEKVIVFAHHIDVLDALAAGLAEFGVVQGDGRFTAQQRQAAVDRFQRDPSCRVIVCGIIPMGVGYTMTAARTVVFVELNFVPGNVSQAEDRAHRIGQTENVLVHHIVLEGTIDARMVQILVSKQGIIDRALNTKTALEESAGPVGHVSAGTVEATKKRWTEVDAAVQVASTRAAGESQSRSEIERLAAKINEEIADEILSCLSGVASACDGAHKIDGAGFNKFDSRLGKELAYRPHLTPKQAALGLRLVTKYQRQIGPERVRAIYSAMENNAAK